MEIVIVLGVVSILILALANTFSDRSTLQKYQAEACFNQIDGQMRNFTNAAMMGKKLQINRWNGVWMSVFPDYYIINFDTWNETINFRWGMIDGDSGDYISANLATQCPQKSVKLSMTGAILSQWIKNIVMTKWFREIKPWELSVFYFSWSNAFTGEVKFNMCTTAVWTDCPKEFARWIIDKRVQGIFAQKCLYYTDDVNTCQRRQGYLQP